MATETPQPLYRTSHGARLHIPPCPHVVGEELTPATEHDLGSMDVCSWCRAELDGVGREYFEHLDDAMRRFGSHVETQAAIRQSLSEVERDQIWIPNSQSYIALGLRGAMVAWVGKTYVVPARGELIELPGFQPGSEAATSTTERVGGICPSCFTQMPVFGVCENCA
jgi:hypothetical protein